MVLDSSGSKLELEFGEETRVEDGIIDEGDISSGYNMAYLPPGMLTKNVKPDSVNGKVRLSPTLTWRGMLDDAVLEFERGRLVRWSSRSSKDRLDSLINDRQESERKVDELP